MTLNLTIWLWNSRFPNMKYLFTQYRYISYGIEILKQKITESQIKKQYISIRNKNYEDQISAFLRLIKIYFKSYMYVISKTKDRYKMQWMKRALTTSVRFIWSIFTIRLPVTFPALWNTPTLCAVKLIHQTSVFSSCCWNNHTSLWMVHTYKHLNVHTVFLFHVIFTQSWL